MMDQQQLNLMYCLLCDKDYWTIPRWSRHLYQEGHQRRARVAIRKWDKSMEERSLIVVLCRSTEEMTEKEGVGLLRTMNNYFGMLIRLSEDPDGKVKGEPSKGLYEKVHITDFIWWKESPDIAVVQFENK